MKVYTYDRSERGLAMAKRLNDKPPPGAESIRLFPIPTTKDGVTVNGGDMRISDGLRELGDGELVIGYGIPEDIRNKLTRAGVSVADSAEDEEFLVANAHLTALGALGYHVSESEGSNFQPMNINFGIITSLDTRIRNKQERYAAVSARALERLEALQPEIKEDLV